MAEGAKVKICGLCSLEDSLLAIEAGADYLGFNFFPKSKRYIEPAQASGLIRQLPRENSRGEPVKRVGVFVNETATEVERIARACGLDMLQFHGDEPLEYLERWRSWETIKAVRFGAESKLDEADEFLQTCDYLLFDVLTSLKDPARAYGGSGVAHKRDAVENMGKFGQLERVFLAGGLTPENVLDFLKIINPYAVDVASGVELPSGRKDPQKLRDFTNRVKQFSL